MEGESLTRLLPPRKRTLAPPTSSDPPSTVLTLPLPPTDPGLRPFAPPGSDPPSPDETLSEALLPVAELLLVVLACRGLALTL